MAKVPAFIHNGASLNADVRRHVFDVPWRLLLLKLAAPFFVLRWAARASRFAEDSYA